MAKVKITGHASGSGVITVTAPNTSTDRTITLPDATATIATTTDVAARLPSITDGGNATAMTIDSAENVGIGVVPAAWHSSYTALQIGNQGSITQDASKYFRLSNNVADTGSNVYIATDEASSFQQFNGTHNFYTAPSGSAGANITWTNRLSISNDGRGLSQFTAKAWARIDMDGTFTVNDSHNVSSVTDQAEGNCRVIFDVDMANANYNMSTCGGGASSNNTLINVSAPQDQVTTTHVDLDVTYVHGTANDAGNVNVMIFGD